LLLCFFGQYVVVHVEVRALFRMQLYLMLGACRNLRLCVALRVCIEPCLCV
jgi:hypothetical protein